MVVSCRCQEGEYCLTFIRNYKLGSGKFYGSMYGCLDGWMVGCMNGWMVGWLDGWLDGWVVGWLDA